MNAIETELRDMLREFVGEIIASSIVIACTRAVGRLDETLSRKQAEQLISMINSGLKLYLPEVAERQRCESRVSAIILRAATGGTVDKREQQERVVHVFLESHIVTARMAARELCASAGQRLSTQVKVATVVSELARNIIQYAGEGHIEIRIRGGSAGVVEVIAVDRGPGIGDVDAILRGGYRSKTGMGKGLIGIKRLMDDLVVKSEPGLGTTIRATMNLRT